MKLLNMSIPLRSVPDSHPRENELKQPLFGPRELERQLTTTGRDRSEVRDSKLIFVFGTLLHEGRLTEEDFLTAQGARCLEAPRQAWILPTLP